MKTYLRRCGWAIAGVLAAAVIYRTAWVASHTEGGWKLLCDHFVAGLPPVFTGSAELQDSPHQAAGRWLVQQANRVEADPHSTAADYMGAALALIGRESYGLAWPAPIAQCVGRVMWLGGLTSGRNPPEELYRKLLPRPAELAQKATELDPNRLDSWRLRGLVALLSTQRNWPNLPSFAETQFEAACSHDPENALYNYLAGYENFTRAFRPKSVAHGQPGAAANASTTAPSPDEEFVFDLDLLEKSRRHYEQAMAKRMLASGASNGATLANFIKDAPGPLAIKLQVLHPWMSHNLQQELFGAIASPPRNAALVDATEPEVVAIARWFNQQDFYQRFAAQLTGAEDNSWVKILQLDTKAQSGRPLTAEEGQLRNAWYRMIDYGPRMDQYEGRQRSDGWAIGGIAAAALGWLLIGLGMATYLIGRYWARREKTATRGIGMWSAVAVFSVVLAATFGLFGFIPAYRPKFENYNFWPASVITAAIFLIALTAILWSCGRTVLAQGRLPRADRSWTYQVSRWLMVVVCSTMFIIALFTFTDSKFRKFAFSFAERFPSSLYGSSDDYGSGLDNRVVGHGHSIEMAVAQWGRHYGLYSTALIALALITLLNIRKARRQDRQSDTKRISTCSALPVALRMTSRPAVLIGLFLLLASLICAARWMWCLQGYYQRDLARLADPNWQWREADRFAAEQARQLPLSAPNQPGD